MSATRISQSDLSAYSRCARQKWHQDQSAAGVGPPELHLSRTVYGTVVHHALHAMEKLHHEGRDDALAVALSTFSYFWDPANTGQLSTYGYPVSAVDTWLVRDTYGGLRIQGLQALRDYHQLLLRDDGFLLALELSFEVPIDLGEMGVHTLAGTVDRLSIRKQGSKPYLSLDDFKTGKQPTYLRYYAQWTVYAWASTQLEFWKDFPDPNTSWQRAAGWARRGRWIDMKRIKMVDCGWRAPADYARLHVALKEYVRAVEADIYPLTLTGQSCTYCPYREVCGGIPLPDEMEGAPA